jgi:hypothetical protein
MKTEIEAVADAFKTVSGDARYRGRWIQDSDYAAVIRLEYGFLNKSLSRDGRFKSADDSTVGNGAGTFRDVYTPDMLADGDKNNRGRIRCYYVTDAGKSRSETRNGESWYKTVQSFRLGPRPRLQISDDCKNELQTLLVLRAEKASQPAPTPTKNMHQQVKADMNYVTQSLSGKKRGLPPVSASSQWPFSAFDGPEESQPPGSIVDGLELMFGKLIYVLQLKCLELPPIPTMHRFAYRSSVTTSANSL